MHKFYYCLMVFRISLLDSAYTLQLAYNSKGLFQVQTSQMVLVGNKKNQPNNINQQGGERKKTNPWLLTLMKTEPALEEQSANLVKLWEIRSFPKLGTIKSAGCMERNTGETKKAEKMESCNYKYRKVAPWGQIPTPDTTQKKG